MRGTVTSSEKEPKDSQGGVDASETLAGQQSQTRKAPGCASPFTGPSEEATLRAEGGGRVGQRLQGAGTSPAAGRPEGRVLASAAAGQLQWAPQANPASMGQT